MDARTFKIKPETYADKGGIKTVTKVEAGVIADILKKHFDEFSKAIYVLEVKGKEFNVPELPDRYLGKINATLDSLSVKVKDLLAVSEKTLEDNAIIQKAEYNKSFETEVLISSRSDAKLLEYLYALNELWICNDTLRIIGILKYDEAHKEINEIILETLKMIYEADKYSKLVIIKRIEIITNFKKNAEASKKQEKESDNKNIQPTPQTEEKEIPPTEPHDASTGNFVEVDDSKENFD